MPVGDLNRLQRRLRYVEAALVQMLREERRLREWFSAPKLVSMGLPGLPRTASGLTRHARERGWESKITRRDGAGEMRVCHFASLPPGAFEALIGLVMRTPAPEPAVPGAARA